MERVGKRVETVRTARNRTTHKQHCRMSRIQGDELENFPFPVEPSKFLLTRVVAQMTPLACVQRLMKLKIDECPQKICNNPKHC